MSLGRLNAPYGVGRSHDHPEEIHHTVAPSRPWNALTRRGSDGSLDTPSRQGAAWAPEGKHAPAGTARPC